MKKVTLPSGRELLIKMAPFAEAKELFQVLCRSLVGVRFDYSAEMDYNFLKEVFFIVASSRELEECVWKCLPSCRYDGAAITTDTFELDVTAREDYLEILYEVGAENIFPFGKNLSARLGLLIQLMTKEDPKSS